MQLKLDFTESLALCAWNVMIYWWHFRSFIALGFHTVSGLFSSFVCERNEYLEHEGLAFHLQ